ncbi:hypothetical protein M0R45_004254 [Rubus argutus]|uniref:Hexosyltransferase n=1 Tax=Rubus argutus TaxID=59490 RepID=A0AAW1YJ99_RUBAR
MDLQTCLPSRPAPQFESRNVVSKPRQAPTPSITLPSPLFSNPKQYHFTPKHAYTIATVVGKASFLLFSFNHHQCHPAATTQPFKEAPKFYNSESCPSLGNDNTVCSDVAVHVAIATLDAAYLRGSMRPSSLSSNTPPAPKTFFFHFVAAASSSNSLLLSQTLSSSFPYLKFRVYPFGDSAVAGLISTSIRSALDCPLNYARNYLANLLPPCVRRVVYLDSDLVLVDDIAKLAATPLGPHAVLAAPEYCNANFTTYFTPSSGPTRRSRSPSRAATPATSTPASWSSTWTGGGRAGTRVGSSSGWSSRSECGSTNSGLTSILLVFAGNIASVDHRWNQHGLGGDNFRGLCRDLHPGPVSLLHWSGKGKPWVRLDSNRPCPLDALWAPYDLLQTPFALES